MAARIQTVHVETLGEELAAYVSHRMTAVGGCRRTVVEPAALEALSRHAAGDVTPQLVELTLTECLLAARLAGQKSVTAELMHSVLGTLGEAGAEGGVA